jgi:hypothetical protein
MVSAMDMCEAIFSTDADGKTQSWRVERLWELAEGLPVSEVAVPSLEHMLDEVVWFNVSQDADHDRPTARAVAVHSERIHSADLSYPILLSAAGEVMDGMHRLAKAWMLGMDTIKAKQFVSDPEPCWSGDE